MILLPAYCSNEYNSEGVNIAAVYVDLRAAVNRSKLITLLKKKNPQLNSMSYWDDGIMFYHLSDAQILRLATLADNRVEDRLFFEKPDDIMEPYGNPIRTDCDQMMARTAGMLSWSAYDHYCSDRMETDQIHVDMLRTLMKAKRKRR